MPSIAGGCPGSARLQPGSGDEGRGAPKGTGARDRRGATLGVERACAVVATDIAGAHKGRPYASSPRAWRGTRPCARTCRGARRGRPGWRCRASARSSSRRAVEPGEQRAPSCASRPRRDCARIGCEELGDGARGRRRPARRGRRGRCASASPASITAPVKSSRRACASPTSAGSRRVPPAAAMIPSATSGWPNRARRAGDAEVARERELAAAAEAVPDDRRDGRTREPLDAREERAVDALERVHAAPVAQFGDVGPRHERLARPRR